MPKIDTTIRRWCERCRKYTRSWWDARANEHCTECDPEGKP